MTETGLVHIIDDDSSMRGALAALLASIGWETRNYAAPRDFVNAKLPEVPSCLILDIRMPGISGLEFQQQLTQSGNAIPVIFLTGHADVPMSVRGMKAGAIDFLTKPLREQDMIEAVSTAIARDQARRVRQSQTEQLQTAFASLTPRERQVMGLAAAGRMNKQIAGELAISEVTVKIHRGSAMRKMGARTLADLVRMAEALRSDPT